MNDQKSSMSQPPARGLPRIKHDSAASVAELREFLAQLRGKGPREVVTTIAGNSLVKSTFLAAVSIFLLLFIASASVYFSTPKETETGEANAVSAADSQTVPNASNEKEPNSTTVDSTAETTDPKADSGTGDKTLDLLGVGETKVAPPDKNPLDKNIEDLLDKKID